MIGEPSGTRTRDPLIKSEATRPAYAFEPRSNTTYLVATYTQCSSCATMRSSACERMFRIALEPSWNHSPFCHCHIPGRTPAHARPSRQVHRQFHLIVHRPEKALFCINLHGMVPTWFRA